MNIFKSLLQSVKKIGTKVFGRKISNEEINEYLKKQTESNKKISKDYEKLTNNEKETLERIGIYKDEDKFPVKKIKDKEFYNQQINKFKTIMESDDVFKDKMIGDTRAFLDVFSKSKYGEVNEGKAYNDFVEALRKADPDTRYEFFQTNRKHLTKYYQRANIHDINYNPKQLEKTLKDFTKMLNKEKEISTYEIEE